jgi:redox-sensitive bicupin YhaK (pirin superfamily)
MSQERNVAGVYEGRPTLEGAGVHLKRVFGYHEAPNFDPFLMLDDFHSDNPADYLAGFPWHPHRGIETVTYMLDGKVEHGDSLGNSGTIRAGQIQWMTAGSGIIHQEMPKGENGRMAGLQLWVNLPRSHKMIKPRYRDVHAEDIPLVRPDDGVEVKIISGKMGRLTGPVRDIICDIEYLDVSLSPGKRFEHAVGKGRNAFAYVLRGEGVFDRTGRRHLASEHLAHYGDGEKIVIETAEMPLRFLFLSGVPLNEPVAWRGPIVMNTWEELDLAFKEYHAGTFIKG